MEPLGESQVLSYLKKISSHQNVFLISFEKIDDLKNKNKLKEFFEICSNHGIYWKPLKYDQSLKYISSLKNILNLCLHTFRILKVNNIDVMHIRSYMPGIAALALKNFFKFSLVFDMRGLWPDEKVDRLGWNRNQIKYKFFKHLEARLLIEAKSIITLTNELKYYLIKQGYDNKKICTIRTCVNFDAFYPISHEETGKGHSINLGYLGSADTAYDISRVIQLFDQIIKIQQNVNLTIFTKSNPNSIYEIAKNIGIESKFLEVRFCERKNLNKEINKLNAIVFFLKPSFSLLASMPTKIGESLACNVPIICNSFNRDIVELVGDNLAGKLIEFNNTKKEALETLSFINNYDQKFECLDLAKKEFNLDKGVKKILNIYQEI